MRLLTQWALGGVCHAAFLSRPRRAMAVLRVLRGHSEAWGEGTSFYFTENSEGTLLTSPIPKSRLKVNPLESFSIPLLLSSGKGAEKAFSILREGEQFLGLGFPALASLSTEGQNG